MKSSTPTAAAPAGSSSTSDTIFINIAPTTAEPCQTGGASTSYDKTTKKFAATWRKKVFLAQGRRLLLPAEEKRYEAHRHSVLDNVEKELAEGR